MNGRGRSILVSRRPGPGPQRRRAGVDRSGDRASCCVDTDRHQICVCVVTDRGDFVYVAGATIDDADPQPLFRLGYVGSPNHWDFAIYLASRDGYEDSVLPAGRFVGTPADALDCACGLYLNDISAWTDATTDSRDNL